MNYIIKGQLTFPLANGITIFFVNTLNITDDDTSIATGIILSVNDNNGNPIIPSLDFLNNNSLKITLIQGATISSTIIPPNSFVVDNVNNYYNTLTSIDLTFTPDVTFTNGPITIQIETL